MGRNMNEFRNNLIHKLEIARINRKNITSMRDTNIHERLWRMHILKGKSFPKKIVETIFDMSTYFRYIQNAERLDYVFSQPNRFDCYAEAISTPLKKKRGRPSKSTHKEYDYMQENRDKNRDYQQYNETNHKEKYDPYTSLPQEYFPKDAQNEFLHMRDSWSNLFKTMTKGVNNESVINNYYEDENNQNYNRESIYYEKYTSEPMCAHCNACETSLWRRIGGKTVCNACGLYYKMHGVVRPQALKKTIIKKRRRLTKRKKGEDEEEEEEDEKNII